MTDDVKDNELDEETISTEPDFSPSVAAPVLDDSIEDDDPHASFNPIAAVDDDLLDPYGVGAPKMDHTDDEDELEEELDTDTVDAY